MVDKSCAHLPKCIGSQRPPVTGEECHVERHENGERRHRNPEEHQIESTKVLKESVTDVCCRDFVENGCQKFDEKCGQISKEQSR